MVFDIIASGIAGFLFGMILNDKLKDFAFFKYIWSPIEISSKNTLSNFRIEKYGSNVHQRFDDTIMILNRTDNLIKIDKMIAEPKILDKEHRGKKIEVVWAKDEETARKYCSAKPCGGIATLDKIFPILLKPKDCREVHLHVFAETEKDKYVRTMIEIYPDYRYKTPKLKYPITFRHESGVVIINRKKDGHILKDNRGSIRIRDPKDKN